METLKPTVKKKKSQKKLTWYENHKFINSWGKFPPHEMFIEKLCEEMINHFDNPKNVHFIKFITERGIIYDTFLDWTKKDEKLRGVHRLVMQKIGIYREDMAMRREHNCDPKTLHYTLRHYDPLWRKSYDEETELKLKQTEKGSNETKIVVIEKFSEAKNEK